MKWWNRDTAKNHSRRVVEELESDERLAPGIREELCRDLAQLVGRRFDDGDEVGPDGD